MQTRSSQTRQTLVEATAELIANGALADAGLVNICSRAGVTRGALYHHFASTAELVAAVYEQARARLAALIDEAFDGDSADAPERFLVALFGAVAAEEIVRAGLRLAADGSDRPPQLRDELLAEVRARLVKAHDGLPVGEDLADLMVVVAAGLESLGRADTGWWDGATSERLWRLLRPLYDSPN
ncbi:TetR/AcrR family transcriptional regulator [Streptomyces sp. TLI_171]|uniref:TetR/AcrR family transcriptional regulator n=1 Tax=Streptomyces sp. TLI_171 TaxID=1938859 RepID=UPI000C1A3E2F|nr:TetR/AcrR family transcriptional regulator [Streptomyces sp. TLI_171]RKE19906.1 TetR family transcriptional regulator [Streptomyces sp. TLI_171]